MDSERLTLPALTSLVWASTWMSQRHFTFTLIQNQTDERYPPPLSVFHGSVISFHPLAEAKHLVDTSHRVWNSPKLSQTCYLLTGLQLGPRSFQPYSLLVWSPKIETIFPLACICVFMGLKPPSLIIPYFLVSSLLWPLLSLALFFFSWVAGPVMGPWLFYVVSHVVPAWNLTLPLFQVLLILLISTQKALLWISFLVAPRPYQFWLQLL